MLMLYSETLPVYRSKIASTTYIYHDDVIWQMLPACDNHDKILLMEMAMQATTTSGRTKRTPFL